MSGILYISYDGMLEPLGQSQVLAHLERLASDFTVHLVSFEKAEDWNKMHLRSLVSARMRTAGISWHPLRYHKAPSALATAYYIAQGIRVSTALVRRHRLTVIHARSYVPSVMALGCCRSRRCATSHVANACGLGADQAGLFQDSQCSHQAWRISRMRRPLPGKFRGWRHGSDHRRQQRRRGHEGVFRGGSRRGGPKLA